MKLPKQWLHWARLCRLYPEQRRGRHRGHSLYGCGRYWRVTCHGDFQVSCREENFDKWCNSVAYTCPLPKTRREFYRAFYKMYVACWLAENGDHPFYGGNQNVR